MIQAQNDIDAAQAQLSAALGYSDQRTFHLQDQPLPDAPPSDFAALLEQALKDRPELIGSRFDAASAHAFATAQRDLWFPTLSAAGSAGLTPYGRQSCSAICGGRVQLEHSDFQRSPFWVVAERSELQGEGAGRFSKQPGESDCAGRSHGVAQCERGVSAVVCH